MNVLRIKPFTGQPADALGGSYDIAISEDQTCVRATSTDPPLDRAFCFDRVFSPNYPASAFYEYACRSFVDDTVFDRRSFAIAVLGPSGSGKTYTSCAIVRRAAAVSLAALPSGATMELSCTVCGEAGAQPKSVLQQSFPAGTEQAQVEQFLGRAVQDSAPLKTESSAMLLRLRQSNTRSVLTVIDGPSLCLPFQQALHKFVTTRSALALRESRILSELRATHLGAETRSNLQKAYDGAGAQQGRRLQELLTVPETNLQVVHCLDGELGTSASRFKELLRHLSFAETLTESVFSPSQHAERDLGEAVTTSSLQHAMQVQQMLRERLQDAKRQLTLAEQALLEEKRRSSERESELRRQLVSVQGRLEGVLAKNFSLEQEVAMLREELARANRGAADALDGVAGQPPRASAESAQERAVHRSMAAGESLAERMLRRREEERLALLGSSGTLRADDLGPEGSGSRGPHRSRSGSRSGSRRPAAEPVRLPKCEEQFDDFLARVAHMSRKMSRR